MAINIMDQFKKCCTIHLKEDAGIYIPGCPDAIIVLAWVTVVQFDMIGLVVDYEGIIVYIPWGSVKYIQAVEVGA